MASDQSLMFVIQYIDAFHVFNSEFLRLEDKHISYPDTSLICAHIAISST